MPAPFA
jgi:hypothetical protein